MCHSCCISSTSSMMLRFCRIKCQRKVFGTAEFNGLYSKPAEVQRVPGGASKCRRLGVLIGRGRVNSKQSRRVVRRVTVNFHTTWTRLLHISAHTILHQLANHIRTTRACIEEPLFLVRMLPGFWHYSKPFFLCLRVRHLIVMRTSDRALILD